MKVTIIGSFQKNMEEIRNVMHLFITNGYTILSPGVDMEISPASTFLYVSERPIKNIKSAIANSDFVYLVNSNGYVGTKTTEEIEHANAIEKPIYALEKTNTPELEKFNIMHIHPEELLQKLRS